MPLNGPPQRCQGGGGHFGPGEGSLFPSHDLYIVEASGAIAQDANGLPVGSGLPPTLMTPKPRVTLGAKQVPGPGGALARVGDAVVTNLNRADWPMNRLLDALGFRIDAPDGELYRLCNGWLREAGPSTWELVLERAPQPRA